MNFAIPFLNNSEFKQNTDIQYNIIYKPKIRSLNDFISQYGDKHRINLIFTAGVFQQERDIEIIKVLKEAHPQCEIVMRLPEYDKELEATLTQNQLPHYYFDMLSKWGLFNGFLKLNVTDIYIAEEICFSLPIAKEKAEAAGKKLRTYANFCMTYWEDDPSITGFFIRPEDIDIYSKYFDTIEFFPINEKGSEEILYDTYRNKKKWAGSLKEIIVNYRGNQDSRFILPTFAPLRTKCGQTCIINSNCKICNHIQETANILKQKSIMIVEKK